MYIKSYTWDQFPSKPSELPENITYIKIGIESPQSTSIVHANNKAETKFKLSEDVDIENKFNKDKKFKITCDGMDKSSQEFYINENDILEFNNLNSNSISINVEKMTDFDTTYTIITLGYEREE